MEIKLLEVETGAKINFCSNNYKGILEFADIYVMPILFLMKYKFRFK